MKSKNDPFLIHIGKNSNEKQLGLLFHKNDFCPIINLHDFCMKNN